MRIWTVVLLTVVTVAGAVSAAAQLTDDDRRTLRQRIESRYDVVPLTDGLALRPKTRTGDVRLIEIADGSISINGSAVSGRELRERLRDDAEHVLRLSYLSSQDQRALFEDAAAPVPRDSERERDMQRAEERRLEAEAQAAATRDEFEVESRPNRSHGDRVRIFGDVVVREDEEITGEVVAVMGDVKIEGVVRNQVVAVLGDIELGPKAVVLRDIVSVGGHVRKAEGARTRGGVTEVGLMGPNVNVHFDPWFRGWGFGFPGFGAVPRLIGSGFRLLFLLLLTGMALLIARPTVESAAQRAADDPVKSTIVGLAAELLIVPVLVIAAILFAITIILSPLILLLPFVVLLLVLMALAGFAGVAGAIGQWVQRRFSLGTSSAFVAIALGVFIVLLPLLVGRVIAIGGWPLGAFATWFIMIGFVFELLVWACGLGAVLTNTVTRWRARRAAVRVPAAPPATA